MGMYGSISVSVSISISIGGGANRYPIVNYCSNNNYDCYKPLLAMGSNSRGKWPWGFNRIRFNNNNKKKKKNRNKRKRITDSPLTSTFPLILVMNWQDSKVKMDIEVPVSVAYKCYSDNEAIPKWMPFISSVKILEDKPDLSRWSLKYKAFGQDIEFSWLARNLQPIPNQKIHWRSLEGLPNRGAVRFYPKGPSSCTVELTVSYEVPQILIPVASALQPFLESLLIRGLERFAKYASTYSDASR